MSSSVTLPSISLGAGAKLVIPKLSSVQLSSVQSPQIQTFSSSLNVLTTKSSQVPIFNITPVVRTSQAISPISITPQIPINIVTPEIIAPSILAPGTGGFGGYGFGDSFTSFAVGLPPLLWGADVGGLRKRRVGGRRAKGYIPSFKALVFGIKGKKPKGIETGLRTRPITKVFSFGKIKFKF